jgi:protein gp37
MADTSIEWAEKVWNPVTGCTKVSEGCRNCYAERIAARFWGNRKFSEIQWHSERLEEPFHWKKPARIFVDSMSDLFHPKVPPCFRAEVFDVMNDERAAHHTFIVATKRPEQISPWLRWLDENWPGDTPVNVSREVNGNLGANVWGLVSVEDQETARTRIPLLLENPFVIRGVSCEPLLGPLNLSRYFVSCNEECDGEGYQYMGDDSSGHPHYERCGMWEYCRDFSTYEHPVDWVILGGESGPDARPMHPDWARSIRDQCQAAGVPFFFKQWGEWTTEIPQGISLANREMTYAHQTSFIRVGKKLAGSLLDGKEWKEFPL